MLVLLYCSIYIFGNTFIGGKRIESMFTVFEVIGSTFNVISFSVFDDGISWVAVDTVSGRQCFKGIEEFKAFLNRFIPNDNHYKISSTGIKGIVHYELYSCGDTIKCILQHVCDTTRITGRSEIAEVNITKG